MGGGGEGEGCDEGPGIQKEPGCSSIEVENEIHEFLLGDIRHPQREETYEKLVELSGVLKKGTVRRGCGAARHCGAICCGLIAAEPGATIRAVKNLRVCSDCHSMIKLVTKVEKMEIVVRDRNRFHHFEEDGTCSCGDNW